LTHPVIHVWRLLKWGRTLARHGALRGIERDPLTPPAVRRLVRIARLGARVPKLPAYAVAFESIGPAAIKLGQALATRPDLVGPEAAADLMRLQDALPPAPFAQVRAAIEKGLDKPLDSVFASIDPEPVGAASIAQVHRAVTTDGRQVAVKVLRPGIEEEFAKALETYEWAAAQAEAMGGELARLRPRLVIATFRQWTARELDLRREAASASELAECMKAEPGFIVPDIDWKRTARRVMTLEWVDGLKLSDRDTLIAAGHDPKQLAALLVRAFLRQAIADGFFHADLHQGNLFVLPDGRIAAIDFGIMGRIDRRARVWLAEIIHGLITGNYARVAEIHFEAGYVPPHHNLAEFTTALRAVGEPIRGLAVKDPRLRYADPAAPAAAPEDDGDGGGGGAGARSRHQHVGDERAVRARMAAFGTRPGNLARRPARGGSAYPGGPPRARPPYRGTLPAPGRGSPAAAAARGGGGADRRRLALCAGGVPRGRGRGGSDVAAGVAAATSPSPDRR
jgi:ubiquinone biosynthesis protein